MHKSRHTAGQRLLDHTPAGNLKAVQKPLGALLEYHHRDIYTDWENDQLEREAMEKCET